MDEIAKHVEGMIEYAIETLAQIETQQVLVSRAQFYSVDTKRIGLSSDEMTMMHVGLLTPYAGDGYGMVCAPRSTQNMVVAPLQGKNSASVALGRVYLEGESPPEFNVGDFIIHHETHSELAFRYTQPVVDYKGNYSGTLLTLGDLNEGTTDDRRIFSVKLDDDNEPALQEGDSVTVFLKNELQDVGGDQRDGDVKDPRVTWLSKVRHSDEKGFYVEITTSQLSNGINLTDYSSPKLEQFAAFRILPDKGTLELMHYTNSGLYIEEYPDYALIDIETGNPRVVRQNVNAVISDVVYVKDDDGKLVQISKHRPKGLFNLFNYNESGLSVKEKQIQYRGTGTELLLQLKKGSPLNDINDEATNRVMPEVQFVMEDITQDERDVGTRVVLRQISSGQISDETVNEDTGMPILKYQTEDKAYGYDETDNVTVESTGSGFVIEDYLKKYDDDKKGWLFATVLEADEQYKAFDDLFYDAADEGINNRESGEGEYDLDYKKRIIPASGRRDVMLKREGSEDKVPLLNSKLEPLTEENQIFIGQKGYMYKTKDGKDVREDGYLCNPKGGIGFHHYTRSGVAVRELDPDLDFHAIQASFDLYNWDLGQYFKNNKFSKNRDSDDMTFSPYPLPVVRLVMETAKIDASEDGKAVIPTMPVTHTQHPQVGIKDNDYTDRTTLSTYGETGTWAGLEQMSSRIQKVSDDGALFDEKRFGSRILFKDYVVHVKDDDKKTPLISAAKWKNKRGSEHNLLAPKGSAEFQHYTGSGLAIYDQRQHYRNKELGGHAMALKLSLQSFDFAAMEDDKPVTSFENADDYFVCQMLSNELVDAGDYTFNLDEKSYSEDGSQRGKKAEQAHGKRASLVGIGHGTVRTKNHDVDARIYFEDYVIPVDEESDSLEKTIQPSHIYKPKEEGKTRELLMPKGIGGFDFWNNSQLMFGDAEKQNEEGTDPDDVQRGKKQLPFTLLSLNAWNNQKIDNPDSCEAAPFETPSAHLKMENIANVSSYNGKDATKVALHAMSCKVKSEDYGNVLLFEDFTKDGSGADETDTQHYYEDSAGAGGSGEGMTNAITDYDASGGTDVDIPPTINGNPVENIGKGAFEGKGLTSVKFPEGVKTIGVAAMKDNLLSNVEMPESLEVIQDDAFKNNKLTEVIVPERVQSIGKAAFENNNIANMHLPSELTDVAENLFKGNQLESITNLPNNLESIQSGAFMNNIISQLNLPPTVKSIAKQAFSGNHISSVSLPQGLQSLGAQAFAGNALSSIGLPDSLVSIGKKAFEGLSEGDISLGAGHSDYFATEADKIMGHIAKPNSNLQIPSVSKGNLMTKIDTEAFFNENLDSVSIPASIAEIGDSAFKQNNFSTLTLMNGLKSVGKAAFSDNNITNLVLPDTLESVEDGAFLGNTIEQVTLPEGMYIGDDHALGTYGDSLKTLYNSLGQVAGTYQYIANAWSKL